MKGKILQSNIFLVILAAIGEQCIGIRLYVPNRQLNLCTFIKSTIDHCWFVTLY